MNTTLRGYSEGHYGDSSCPSSSNEEGNKYVADITKLCYSRDAIAQIRGFIGIVPQSKPDNPVKFKVTWAASRFAPTPVDS